MLNDVIRDGGPWAIVPLVLGLGLYVSIIAQWRLRHTHDLRPLISNLALAIGLVALLGMILGWITIAGLLVETPPDERLSLLSQGVVITLNVGALAALILIPATLARAVVTTLAFPRRMPLS